MNEAQPKFDGRVGDEFSIDYYDSVRGYVRQEITRLNLLPYINIDQDLDIADVGGGDGRDSEWATGMGHHLTFADESGDMVEKARARNAAEHYIHGDLDTLLDIRRESKFDMVMSHVVIPYVPDPEEHVKKLAGLLKTGGRLSLLTSSYKGSYLRLLDKRDVKGINELRRTGANINNLGIRRRAFNHQEIQGMLKRNGMVVEKRAGVRSMVAERNKHKIGEMETEELKTLLIHEYHYGNDRHSRDRCQLLHFIARKV